MIPLYEIKGRVIAGQKRGKSLGFPTANLPLTQPIPDGIYASIVILEEKTYKAATFIGNAGTFNEVEKKAESYILDFDQTIYGKEIVIKLYERIRDNQNFDSVEALVEQMTVDVKNIKDFFIDNSE